MTKSALQIARAAYQPKLPKGLTGTVKAVAGAATQSVADQEEIKKLFPNTYGMPLIKFENTDETVDFPAMNVGVDVNSMKPLDNLCHPVSVIREAEELAADAFGAAHAFLMVGGTTSSVQTMVLTACKRGDEIILPRNVHRSVLNALVLCGAIPVYVNPEVDQRLGISLGM